MVIVSAFFLALFIDLAMSLHAAAKKEQMMFTTKKGFSSTEMPDVNAISTKEKQQSVFQSLKVFYDSLIFWCGGPQGQNTTQFPF